MDPKRTNYYNSKNQLYLHFSVHISTLSLTEENLKSSKQTFLSARQPEMGKNMYRNVVLLNIKYFF